MSHREVHAGRALDRLVGLSAEGGESITIARAGRAVAQLAPMTRASQPRVPGMLHGQIPGAESLLDRDIDVEELFNGARE